MGGRGGRAVQELAVTSSGSDDGPLAWNVAGLLSDDPGADRILEVESVDIDLGEDLRLARPIDGRVRLLRTNRGILAHADLRTSLALECSRCLRDIEFPVEIRFVPSDDVPLSPAYGRDVTYLAVHTPVAVDHHAFFAGVEPILRDHLGRPHWGKLHTLGAEDLATLHPRFADFLAVRDRLDPDRVFGNAHLRHVLCD